MSRFKQTCPRFAHANGFGLIELMISITISFVVVLAVITLFLSQKRSYAAQDDLSRLEESARFMIQDVTLAFRMAGYRDPLATTTFADPTFVATEGSNAAGASSVAASDSFALRFFGSSKPEDAAIADGSILDCKGNAIPRDTLVLETFSIQNVGGVPSLICLVNADVTPTVLYSNVDSMQILYGLDTNNDGAVDVFRPAVALSTADMELIKSALISFVMRTTSTNNPSPDSSIFNHFGSAYAPGNVAPTNDLGSVYTVADDHRLRRQFSFSVGLRNRLN